VIPQHLRVTGTNPSIKLEKGEPRDTNFRFEHIAIFRRLLHAMLYSPGCQYTTRQTCLALLSHSLQYLSNSGVTTIVWAPSSLPCQAVRSYLGWNGTISLTDTLATVATIGYAKNSHKAMPPWSHFSEASMSNSSTHTASYKP
jgi:hypothetical protein